MKLILVLLASVVLLPLAIAGYSYYIEPKWVETTRVTVYISGLPREFDGLRLVQISDLHVGPYTSKGDVDGYVKIVNGLQPDAVVITGDFISKSIENIYPCAVALENLNPRLATYAVLGNHDFATDPDVVARVLQRIGIKVLRNDADAIARGSQHLWILGVDDVYLFQDDLPAARQKVSDNGKTILLCHSPDIAQQASDAGIDLILAGHTHGGQVRLPFVGALVVPVENDQYEAGLYSVGHSQLYVNRGLGVVEPPVRFLSRPEITLLTLRSK